MNTDIRIYIYPYISVQTHLHLHIFIYYQVPALPPLGSGLLLRPLLLSDFNTGFLPLLTQLTSVGEVTW